MLAQTTPPPAQPSIRCGAPERHATVFTFRTRDGVRLDGAIVGSGPRGVVLVTRVGLGRAVRLVAVRRPAGHERRTGDGLRPALLRLLGCPIKHVQGTGSDAAAAVAALRRHGATSVAVVGASMGGSAAIVGAAQAGRVSAVVSLSGDENARTCRRAAADGLRRRPEHQRARWWRSRARTPTSPSTSRAGSRRHSPGRARWSSCPRPTGTAGTCCEPR